MKKTINDTKIYSILKERESPFLHIVDELFDFALNLLPKINKVFANYTGHDNTHSLRVLDYMYLICDYPNKLSDLELVAMVYSSLLHDIGMVVDDEEIEQIKQDKNNITDIKYSLVLKKYQKETIALQECIRPIHGKRSRKFINNMPDNLFILPGYTNTSFKNDIAKICEAHNENFEWIKDNLENDQKKGKWELNSQFIALLLRLADYLDLDEARAPLYLYKYLKPKHYSNLEWQQHFAIDNIEKVSADEKTGRKYIEFYGESSKPEIHRKLLKYFDSLNNELKKAVEYSETFQKKLYVLSIQTTVHNKIRTIGFNFSDFKLSLDYTAVTGLLMGENIYGDKKYGLRELIQNSIDACKVMQEESKIAEEFKYSQYKPFISIVLDEDRKEVNIFDNGIGMSVDILKKYFLNVGVSYYKSDDYLFKGNNYIPIGNYGVGFLACFMLSDKVNVKTKHFKENKSNQIEFEKKSEYICLTYKENIDRQGTEIILNYNQFLSVFHNNQNNIESFIKANFIDCQIPITLNNLKDGKMKSKELDLKTIDSFYPETIRLDKYFEGIEVALQFSYKGIIFVENFSDICIDTCYLFEENKLVSDQDLELPILLKDYIIDGKIKFLRLPLIYESNYDSFSKAYDVLEDFEEALEKCYYENTNIITANPSLINDSILIEDNEDYIIGKFNLSNFRNQCGHSKEAPTYTFIEEKNVIKGSNNTILLYNLDIGIYETYSFNNSDCLFIKNVLISNNRFKIPYLADGIRLKGLAVNIMNKKLIPNVSRNDISNEQNNKLAYAIGKALHIWLYENGNFDSESKEVLKEFINTCYSNNNYFLKNNSSIYFK